MVAAVYRPPSTTATRHSAAGWRVCWGGGLGGQSQLSQAEGGVTAPQQVTGLSQGHVLTPHYSETVIDTQHNFSPQTKPGVSPCFTSETNHSCKTALSLHIQAAEDLCKVSNANNLPGTVSLLIVLLSIKLWGTSPLTKSG